MTTNLVGRWPAHAQREKLDAAPVAEVAALPHDEALEFVRFCYRRRHVGWPELYDEMCLVAGRGAFRGLGYAELADHGISFCLGELTRLATLTERVVQDEQALHDARSAGVPMMLTSQPATS